MRRLAVAVLIALAALLVFAPDARPATPGQHVGRGYMNVARGVWGPTPCGVPVITYAQLNPYIDGIAWRFSCAADIQVGLTEGDDTPYLCTVIVHEYGHLAGQDHREGDRIMDPSPPEAAPPCKYAYDPLVCAETWDTRREKPCERKRRYWRKVRRG